jgi:hypothetical protein
MQAEQYIQHPVRIFVTGRSGTGKTTTTVDLIHRILRHQLGTNGRLMVASPTWELQKVFDPIRNMVKSEKDVFTQPEKGMFQKIVKRLQKEKLLAIQHSLPVIQTLILVDDFSGSRLVHSSSCGISELAVQTRHLNTSMIVISQQPKQTSNAFRQNCECLISFPPTSREGLDWLVSEFNGNQFEKELFFKICQRAWKGKRKDFEEYNTHFLFVLITPRKPTRYFCDFNVELTPKTFRQKINENCYFF